MRADARRCEQEAKKSGGDDAADGQDGAPVPRRLYRLSVGRTQSQRVCCMSRHPPGRRADYRWFHSITTRWMDNDVFRHVNNVNYFSFFDTAETYFEMPSGVFELLAGPVHCVVAEVTCRYHSSVAFPDRITVGVRVARIGSSSVRYEIGIFRNDDEMAAAEVYFVHLFVDRASQRPVHVPAASRAILETIAVAG